MINIKSFGNDNQEYVFSSDRVFVLYGILILEWHFVINMYADMFTTQLTVFHGAILNYHNHKLKCTDTRKMLQKPVDGHVNMFRSVWKIMVGFPLIVNNFNMKIIMMRESRREREGVSVLSINAKG